ncbi:type II secretion system protein GspN [bacterium]|nr:type II secretion system protein GspN [bacterium]
MLKKLLLSLIFVFLIMTIIVCSTWVNLNSSAIVPWLESKVNSQIPRQYSLTIESVENYLLGSKINQVILKDITSNESLLAIDSINLKINWISLFLFQELQYNIGLYEGSIIGKIDLFPQIKTSYQIKDIQINRNAFIRKTNLILSNPTLEGEGNFDYTKTTGNLELNCSALKLTGDQQNTNLPFLLPSTTFDNLKSEWSFSKNQANLQIISSGDITANLKGTMDLNFERISKSKLDLQANARLAEKYETNLGFLKSLLVNYRDNSGQIAVKISGDFERPSIKKFNP